MRKHKKAILLVACSLIYAALLFLLVYAERNQTGNHIAGFFDALWYSVVTMTTVGYGDQVPQSAVGRIIGAVFLLMSLGVLTALLTLAYGLLTGQVLPWLRLFLLRRRNWHIFPQCNEESAALAAALKEEDPEAVTIFSEAASEKAKGDILIHLPPERLLPMAKGSASVYFLGELTQRDCARAVELAQVDSKVDSKVDIQVYCSAPVTEFSGLHCFHPAEGCAREFWRRYPLQPGEQSIVIIGDQAWMPLLLEQALLVNVYSLEQQLQYHIYGDDGRFRQTHYRLSGFCTDGESVPGMDRLCFHDGFPEPEVLSGAHRIILCREADGDNLELLSLLRMYFPLPCNVYVHLNQTIPLGKDGRVIPFGTAQELYTPEHVIRNKLNDTAVAIHELYCSQNPEYAQPWSELSPHAKASNITAADHLLTKLRILLNDYSITELTRELCDRGASAYQEQLPERRDFFRELEHLRWCRFHYLRNWGYGPVKDPEKRLHPLLTDFDRLPEKEQEKDDNPWEVIGQLSKREETWMREGER